MSDKVQLNSLDLRSEEQKKSQQQNQGQTITNSDPNFQRIQGNYKPMVHLHTHSFHSILDGAGSIDDYVKLAKEYNQPALAITDHGTLSGTFELFKKCKESGIKPIFGIEAYINDEIGQHKTKKDEGRNSHQIILAMNKQGYVNLNKLAYLSFSEGFYYRPRITTEQLIQHKEGLIITTSCVAHKIAKLLLDNKEWEAELYLKRLHEEFGENFVIELQFNELSIQKRYNSFLLKMAEKYKIMPILTSDVHYAYPEDNKLQDTLLAINHRSKLDNSFKFNTRHLYFLSSSDFYMFNELFKFNYPDEFIDACLKNTLKIAEKCNFEFEIGVEKFPKYEPTQDVIDYFKTTDTREIIYKLAFGKLKQKLNKYKENNIIEINDETTQKYLDRLNYELKVIDDKKMLDYFLVNWEIIRDYNQKGYMIGPGRGSACGSLLSYCLDITKIDPIRFDLYFERFLNPTRNCLTENCNVLLKNGIYKNIKEIEIGDPVQTEKGLGKLIQIHERDLKKNEEIYEIETLDGAKIELTGCHIVPVLRKGERIEIRVDEILESDFLFVF